MKIDDAICRRAMMAKDARFDGRFFIGVRTTGIYCRPVCPVPPPKVENVRFYPTAAAAAEAGHRPCLRCRPETAAGTPAWCGTSTTVSRALRMIADGALDRGSVDDLAGPLGVTSRHLSRLFVQHLGASPLAVARTRRLHLAKRMIDDTRLSMADIALSAGFGSVRSFNAAFLETYDRSPSELRKLRTGNAGKSEILLKLAYRPPFDWNGLIEFLEPRATPGVEVVEGSVYRRTILLDGKPGVIEVRRGKGRKHHLELRASFPDSVGLFHIAAQVRGMFDLDADPSEICRHLRRDPLLAPLVKSRPGIRVPGAWDGFELAVRAILGQQVSVRGATTLAGRVVREFGKPLAEPSAGLTHLFPTARRIARADLTRIGMPRTRAAAITGLGRAVLSGKVDFGAAPDEGVRQLTAVAGIGDWTAQYVAMRAFRDPDGFPASDLALLRSLGDGTEPIGVKKLLERAEDWRPWRAYAAMHLWRRYGGLMETKRAAARTASATA